MIMCWDCVLWSGGSRAGIHWVAGTSWHHHVEVRVENVTCYSSPTTPTLFSWLILGCGAFIGTCHASLAFVSDKDTVLMVMGSLFLNHAVFMTLLGKGHRTVLIIQLSSRYFPLPPSPLDNLSERFYHFKEKEWVMKLVIRLRPTNKEMGKLGAVTPRYALLPSLS